MGYGDNTSILEPRTLTGTVKKYIDQDKNRQLSKLFRGKVKPVVGNFATWHEIQFSRGAAPIVGRDDSPVSMSNLAPTERTAPLITVTQSKILSVLELTQEGWPTEREGFGLTLTPNAEARIADEVKELANRISATAELAAAQLLTTGTIKIGLAGAGVVTVPGSRFATNVVFTNVSSLNAGGAYWGTTSTKIVSDTQSGSLNKPSIPAIKAKFRTVGGLEAGTVYAQLNEVSKLQSNTEVQGVYRGSIPGAPVVPVDIQAIESAFRGAPGGGGGHLQFKEYNGTWLPDGGSVTYFIPSGTIFVLADGAEQFLQWHEGFVAIPTGPLAMGGAFGTQNLAAGTDATSLYKLQAGLAAYAILHPREMTIEIIAKWRFMPIITMGEALLTSTVDA